MSSISFIGPGAMARAIATRAVAGGNSVEIIGRDTAKAKGLAAALEMARWLEGVGPLLMGLARHGAGSFDVALSVDLPD
ncbi:MAG TPA: NAD(P)-binding domain-containing protein [Kribbella sp.]|nr:NAD(P)-binding domain-containing protein [Kribbella sp.]